MMPTQMVPRIRVHSIVVLASILLFLLVGLCFIPLAGIEVDEALIASSVAYPHAGIVHQVTVLGHSVPLMIMSYVGALKSWLYVPIFKVFGPSALSLRIPVLVLGGLTIWIFYRLLLSITSPRTALIGCLLLASDPSFFLTTIFDWGPVALQHLLYVSGLWCLVRFHFDDKKRYLVFGFFLFGLAVWDKALAEWILSGTLVATIVIFPKELRSRLSLRNLGIATFSMIAGALPLVIYNISFPFATIRTTAAYSLEELPNKLSQFNNTLNGGDLFGYLTSGAPPVIGVAQDSIERLSLSLSDFTGRPQQGLGAFALLLAVVALPVIWKTPVRKPFLFALIAALVAWLQMLATKGTGATAHHIVLLWPLPMLLLACALSELSRKILLVTLSLLIGSNALVINEYMATLVRNGPGLVWTDAVFPLSERLRSMQAQSIYINDWGIFENVWMLNRGQASLRPGLNPLGMPILNSSDQEIVIARIKDPNAIFVSHPDEYEMFKGLNSRFLNLAKLQGYTRHATEVIADRHGRARFEIFRLTKD